MRRFGWKKRQDQVTLFPAEPLRACLLYTSFLRELRAQVKDASPDAAVLGEVWEDASHKVVYGQMRSYVLGDTLDSVMNYPLRDALIDFLTGDVYKRQAQAPPYGI